jgi:hypothetical protein
MAVIAVAAASQYERASFCRIATSTRRPYLKLTNLPFSGEK